MVFSLTNLHSTGPLALHDCLVAPRWVVSCKRAKYLQSNRVLALNAPTGLRAKPEACQAEHLNMVVVRFVLLFTNWVFF